MDTEQGFRVPYMSFQTFWNYMEELAEKPLPPRIDRSIMKTKSGTDQANLVLAFNSFGLTDAEGNVQPVLTELVEQTSPEDRATAFGNLVQKYYPGPLRVSAENGTPADLTKVFTDDYPSIGSGDTRRKAITFFLHAARKSGIELSPHFPATRSGQGAPGAPKVKRSARKRSPADNNGFGTGSATPPASPAKGHTQTVVLKSGGTVTLTYDVNMFEVSDKDEEFVLSLIKKLRAYRSGAPVTADTAEGNAS